MTNIPAGLDVPGPTYNTLIRVNGPEGGTRHVEVMYSTTTSANYRYYQVRVAGLLGSRTFVVRKILTSADVGTGANQIPDMSAYELVGNSSNGYLKLPNGFKYQWLETSGQVSAGTTGAGYWTYPFTLCLFAFALPVAVSANPVAGNIVAGAFSNSAVELHNWGQISAKARIIGFGR